MDPTVLNITLKKGAPDPERSGPRQQAQLPALLFKGPENTPFLAPRGVWMCGGQLLVSDTGRNRVFIWRNIPTSLYAEPDVVLGQGDADSTGRNGGGNASAHTLQYPSGLWSDGRRLIVADAWNHRVLIWHTMPTRTGQAADVVLGQPDFNRNEPNIAGVGAPPDARTLFWPYGVYSDGTRLWIADTGNRRVLYFDDIPATSFSAAQAVVGKPDLTSRDYDNQNPVWPYSVKIGANGAMAIADTQFYRVLWWRHWRDAFSQPAHGIIGQTDLDGNGQNRYQLHPDADTLSWCYDTAFFADGLLVADTGNSRILRYTRLLGQNGSPADGLLGKPDFQTGSENAETILGTEKNLYWPFSICTEGNRLAVTDTGNHRIVMYNL
ncbi:MAG: hypothetical protein SFV52_06230 [Saprospiraceae bacterium]|nr:hypothetical protein [Saprospiraceae bacterium]